MSSVRIEADLNYLTLDEINQLYLILESGSARWQAENAEKVKKKPGWPKGKKRGRKKVRK